MRLPKLRHWMSAAATLVLLLPLPTSVLAVVFGQVEVNQTHFIAVAVPRTSGHYTLLVLEQLSSQRSCWREKGSKPTRVDPLLLNFNFTGICGRSTDSNGYSIRMAGKDAAMDYRLSFQTQQDDLILLGIPNQTGKTIEVGRTHGLNPGFLKIVLNSGWRFTKRTYNGKKLGHIYFSRDTIAPPYQGSAIAKSTAPKPIPTRSVEGQKPQSSRKPAAKPQDHSSSYRVMVVAPDLLQQARLRTQNPTAFRTSYQGKSVMQVGLFRDRAKAESLKDALKNKGFRVLVVTMNYPTAQADGVSDTSTNLVAFSATQRT